MMIVMEHHATEEQVQKVIETLMRGGDASCQHYRCTKLSLMAVSRVIVLLRCEVVMQRNSGCLWM